MRKLMFIEHFGSFHYLLGLAHVPSSRLMLTMMIVQVLMVVPIIIYLS
jgi:hypothetical protein